MQTHTPVGRNRTGIQASPIDADAMAEVEAPLETNQPVARGDVEVRLSYTAEADPVGSVPVPATLTGVAATAGSLLTGKRPQVLIDKLGERLAFERGGVRLYEGLLVKCRQADGALEPADAEALERFRLQEAEHFEMVAQALVDLGADPTAQTPCADLVGVKAQGYVQAISDPRTSLLQALGAMLDLELADHAGWEMLIELARAAGHGAMADRFRPALADETLHLQTVRALVERLTLRDAKVAAPGG